jgi:16S rRNA (uracil1498-N3)-methyltransferase
VDIHGVSFSKKMHFFLDPEFDPKNGVLNPEESRHALRVLRLREGDGILIGNGKGVQYSAEISEVLKNDVSVNVLSEQVFSAPKHHVRVAISPTKNLSRFEWFLEKATELGISEIIPLITSRTQRPRIKEERSEKIILSASKQSQRVFIPKLHPTVSLKEFLETEKNGGMIAHCMDQKERVSISVNPAGSESLILIGPEGDFTLEEVEIAEKAGFKGVILNDNRLRTETAGILAVAMLQMSNR